MNLDQGPQGREPAQVSVIGRRLRLAGAARLLAVLAAGGLLVLSLTSNWPWLSASLASVLLWYVMAGGRRRKYRALQRGETTPAGSVVLEARLNAVLDAISSATVLIDRRGVVLHMNAAASAAFAGLRRAHPISFALRSPAMLAALEAVLRGQEEARLELVERVPIERSFDVLIRRLAGSSAAAQPENGAAFAVVFMPETTAARRLEAMRVDFVANASHELRTPLASILGFVETLQGSAKDDAVARKSFLAIMETQARRMARLIEDLLSLSRIELSEHIAPSERIELEPLLRSVCDALGGLARDRGVALRVKPPAGTPSVMADRDELLRVFENLIENAVKYGQSGGAVDIAIAETLEAGQPAFAISVKDYGPGIAAEHLPRLTERFYRADVNESRVMGGTGLGLAIVKHIVTRHRGRLAIESRPGEGATFTVLLPKPNTN